MIEFLRQTVAIFVESAPYLLLGFGLAGLSKVFLDRESWLARSLGRKGLRSVGLASVIGAPLPLCSCSVLPAALGLRRQGASKGATSSFLISVPETDIVSVLLTYGLLGPVMAVLRPVAALVTALVTGVAVDALDRDTERASGPTAAEAVGRPDDACDDDGCADDHPPHGASLDTGPWWKRAAHFGFVEFFDDIAGPLILGILLAGLVAALVPAFDTIGFGNTVVLGYVVALVVGIPSYVCATATTPVAVGLIMAGMSPGAALTLLLAGPATNIASFVVLGREFGRRLLLVYLLGIASIAVTFGLLVDMVWGADAVRFGSVAESGSAPSVIGVVSAWILFAMVVGSARRTRLLQTTWARGARLVGLPTSPRFAASALGGVVAVVWGVSGVFTVAPGERAVATVFGQATTDVLGPGLHPGWPPPIGDVRRVDVEGIRALEVGFRRDASREERVRALPRGRETEAWMLTGDENMVDVQAVLHWRVRDDGDAVRAVLFGLESPEQLLRSGLERGLRTAAGRRGIDALLTVDRSRVEDEVRERWLQPFLDRCESGLEVVDISIVDLHAPNAVHWSFRDVASASEDRRRDVHLAAEYAERVVREARGDAARLRAEAIGEAAMRRDTAHGEGHAFVAKVEAFSAEPEVHRRRLYLERLEASLRPLDLIVDLSGDGTGIELWQRQGDPGSALLGLPPATAPLRIDRKDDEH
ncbi:MAG TPA: SO_0444 family Cu/Zn efflux transporter [Candidatus Krumholzibacteria bacterium]|nr:SO_0444 family Cu/Zn efflux transporter [Candidatus Krumholzibacteria bacterium]